ncbi:MAG: four helix bundle protein [Acidobacteria bacterium]|nr:four helix bundle protein [Acidobacteriota bacterium]
MATIKRFEDILGWQKSRQATAVIYEVTGHGTFSKDFGLRDQIRRSSVSIMANIAEGFGRRSDREFANFLNYAHGSVAETQSHLYVALDMNYVSKADFDRIYQLLDETSRILMGFSKHLRGSSRSTTDTQDSQDS